MSIQVGIAQAQPAQDRQCAEEVVRVQLKPITIVVRLIMLISGCLILCTLVVVVVASTGTAPTIIEPSPQILPGSVAPAGLHCGESTDEICYPPVDAHCYESGDMDLNCFASASIQQNDKVISFTINIASRTITLTSIPAREYTMGDLILAWGTPTGFSQYRQAIDVYWGARSASLTTCSFRPESHVELITYYAKPAFTSAWRGFVRVNSKDC